MYHKSKCFKVINETNKLIKQILFLYPETSVFARPVLNWELLDSLDLQHQDVTQILSPFSFHPWLCPTPWRVLCITIRHSGPHSHTPSNIYLPTNNCPLDSLWPGGIYLTMTLYVKKEDHTDNGSGLRTVWVGILVSQVSKIWSGRRGLADMHSLWTTSICFCGFLIEWGMGTIRGGPRRGRDPCYLGICVILFILILSSSREKNGFHTFEITNHYLLIT